MDSFGRVLGVPHLDDIGPELCVDFPVRPLRHAKVVWLNAGWWIEHGWDIDSPDTRKAVNNWLLRHCAVVACEPSISSGQTLAADRYGGSQGTRHGGSGRCGISGAFIAKGIGRTPLCPPEVSGVHGDGCLSMVEALREAVAAELAQAELPWGAVPVVAIIATNDNNVAVSEAILVRPNFVRPAHFERSIFFGTAGQPGSDQHLDALRTRSAVATAAANPSAIDFPGLSEMFERFAAQLGALQAHRLWQGKFLSSNVSVTGALVDFGSFRTVSSWRSFFGEPEEKFGGERCYLDIAARSLITSFEKYAPTSVVPKAGILMEAAKHGIERGFRNATVSALGLKTTQAEILLPALRRYWIQQQRERVQVGDAWTWSLPWLYDVLMRPELASRPSYAAEADVLMALEESSEEEKASPGSVRAALARWTCPRVAFHYERSTLILTRVANAMRRRPECAAIIASRAIDAMLSRVHRNWHRLPADFEIHGQVRQGSSVALYGVSGDERRPGLLLAGPRGVNGVRLFGATVERRSVSDAWIQVSDACVDLLKETTLKVGKVLIAVPSARFVYPAISTK